MLSYDVNGGSGWMFDSNIYTNGSKATVKGATYNRAKVIAPDGKKFVGWNTMPDGSGKGYKAGEKITLDGYVTLYAQYNDMTGFNKAMSWIFDNPIIDFIRTLWNSFKSFFPFC